MSTKLALTITLAFGSVTGSAVANPDLVSGVWKNVTPPTVTTSFKDHVFCQGMTLDPKHPSTVYLCICAFDASKGGLFKSPDSGKTWKKIGPLDEPLQVEVNPNDPNHVYCVDGVRGKTVNVTPRGTFHLVKEKDRSISLVTH